MSTPHNSAEKGQFAKTVLMPGDPLRAKFIAELGKVNQYPLWHQEWECHLSASTLTSYLQNMM